MTLLPENFVQIESCEEIEDPVEISRRFYTKMSARRSVRHFSSAPVQTEILKEAIKAAGTSPSGANSQPWFFALITDSRIKEELRLAAEKVEEDFYMNKATEEWLQDLKPFGTNHLKPYLSVAPALIVVFSRHQVEDATGDVKRTYYPMESTGIAVGVLLTALHHCGLATLTHTPRPMFFLNEVLGLDRTYRPYMIVVTGYPELPLRVPRLQRKSLAEIMTEY